MAAPRIVLLAAVVSLAAGCSVSGEFSIGGESPERAAEKLIEGELADSIGFGPLDASCEDVQDAEVGSEFICTGSTSDDQVINFVTVIDREDHIDVRSTNLIGPDRIPQFESAGAEALGQEFGVQLPSGTIDCGDLPVVFDADLSFVCAYNDPESSDVYDATFQLADLTSGDFTVSIGETPRE